MDKLRELPSLYEVRKYLKVLLKDINEVYGYAIWILFVILEPAALTNWL